MRLNSKQRVETAHEDAVWTAAWISNDAFLTGSVDETVKVWGVGDSVESQHTYTGAPQTRIWPYAACLTSQHLSELSLVL